MLITENYEEIIPITINYEKWNKKVESYIEQVLYYSKINEVNCDYIIKSFNLENSIRNVIKKNATDFINKKIIIDIKDVNEEVYSDPKYFEFILNQIIVNSLKYSKCNNDKITIYSNKNKNNLVLYIKDNGIGISEKRYK